MSSIDQEQLLAVLQALVERMDAPRINPADELWTHEDIATYLKLSPVTVQQRVVTRPDFPAPLVPCPTGVQAAKRWFAGEVVDWARKNRSRLPTPRKRGVKAA